MQVDDVRHDRRAEDADGQQQLSLPANWGTTACLADRAERRVARAELDQVADGDHADDRGDHRLERAEAEALQREDRRRPRCRSGSPPGRAGSRTAAGSQRRARGTRRGRSPSRRLGLDPEPDDVRRENSSRHTSADSAPWRFRASPRGLDQHRHQVRGDDHPDQRVAELGAAGDVGREVARIDVRHAGDECRPEERQDAKSQVASTLEVTHVHRTRRRLDASRHHRAQSNE